MPNNRLKLTKRMTAIVDLIDESSIADIGCDHGKIVGQAFLDKKINFAYLSDISEKSLQKAKLLLGELNIDKGKIEFNVADGLENFSTKSVQQVIIAGMGGELIKKIISKSKIKFKSYILEPQHNEYELKKFLVSNGYQIIFDKIIYDMGKFYNIIKVVLGSDKLTEFDYFFGKDNFVKANTDFKKYLFGKKVFYENVVKNMNNKNDEFISQNLRCIEIAIKKLGEIDE